MGLPDDVARGTLRLTLGYGNTMEQIDQAADAIRKCVAKLRETSGEYEDYLQERSVRHTL